VCGGAISSVSGGKGSPRFGCRRSWQDGHACSNRLPIRIKVAEPQILAKLQAELLQSTNVAYIALALEREAKKALTKGSKDSTATRTRLDQEQRKLQNLVAVGRRFGLAGIGF
jgi:Recombinase zinc beta ribbon domain